MKNIALVLPALLCAFAVANAKEPVRSALVKPIVEDADAAHGGIIYALPKTALRIRIDAELTIEKEGPYYRYSNKYLNLSNAVKADKETWRIVAAEVETFGKADTDKMYKITTLNADAPAVVLTTEGVLAGINTCYTEPAEQQVCAVGANQLVDFESVKHERSVLTKTSSAAMAEETANAIYRLREKRLSLLGGEDATILHDRGSYERVLAELDSLEAEYVSLFAGKRLTIRTSRYYTLTPDPQGTASTVLLRFSEQTGFLDAMDLSGKPVYVDVAFTQGKRLAELPATSKQRKDKPVDGLRYTLPGQMNVKVVDRNILLCEKTVACGQNGQTLTLPTNILLNPNAHVEFDPATGALRGISYSK